jgi:fructose-bisphosphate aldolase class I
VREQQAARVRGDGFIAALDQSGGSTPKALREYGITDDQYADPAEMFDLVHQMRARIIQSPSFCGDRILGAILFEQTMDRQIGGLETAQYLWDKKGIVPFLKVDRGLADKVDGAQRMKDIDGLHDLLERAVRNGIFGTRMRSLVTCANSRGIDSVLAQQFAYAEPIAAAGLVPILEPEVGIDIPDKPQAEAMLLEGLHERLDALPEDRSVMLKLTLPSVDDLYRPLLDHPRVLRVLALPGGYPRDRACALLSRNPGVIASFSRAFTERLSYQLTADEFDARLDRSITAIYAAST